LFRWHKGRGSRSSFIKASSNGIPQNLVGLVRGKRRHHAGKFFIGRELGFDS
jgi:hypothetical protein